MEWWKQVNNIKNADTRGKVTDLIECYLEYGRGSKEAKRLEDKFGEKIKEFAEKCYNNIQMTNAGII